MIKHASHNIIWIEVNMCCTIFYWHRLYLIEFLMRLLMYCILKNSVIFSFTTFFVTIFLQDISGAMNVNNLPDLYHQHNSMAYSRMLQIIYETLEAGNNKIYFLTSLSCWLRQSRRDIWISSMKMMSLKILTNKIWMIRCKDFYELKLGELLYFFFS